MIAFMQNTVDELERKALKVWMRGVMANQSLSAYEWAKRAGASHTNITRFLNQDSKYIPSSRTVAKLVKAAGTSPHPVIPTDHTSRTIEVFDRKGERVRYITVHDVEGKVLAMELEQITGYGLGGINSGDTIIIQEDVKVKDQDIIMYEIEKGFFVGQIIDDRIVHKSTAIQRVEHLADVTVVGKVIQCIKKF